MSQLHIWLFILASLSVAGFGVWLNRHNHPSGVALAFAGLVGAFFSFGFVAGNWI